MARNSEKAQSMLYRFREQQAAEMGMGNRRAGDRRPRIAASVSSLRDCERWRGDVLKEISRKVSKIQDVSLTDYEIRDLNDEINSLMREKRHWETQIVALGGANYKRAQASMTDDAGREVPGTRGYKYFGRAKDLPGVKELFARGAANATEESARNASFQMFRNQGPEYFGDLDEVDVDLAKSEEAAAREAWEEAVAETAKILSIPEADIPYPLAEANTAAGASAAPAEKANGAEGGGKGKRKANGTNATSSSAPTNGDTDATETTDDAADVSDEASKKARTDTIGADESNGSMPPPPPPGGPTVQTSTFAHSFGNLFDPASLTGPTLPSQSEMGEILLEVRKRALREEYGV